MKRFVFVLLVISSFTSTSWCLAGQSWGTSTNVAPTITPLPVRSPVTFRSPRNVFYDHPSPNVNKPKPKSTAYPGDTNLNIPIKSK